MKRLMTLWAVLALLTACDGHRKQVERLEHERDSLLNVTAEQDSVKAAMDGIMETIASTLDSIKMQEGILTLRVNPETGRRYSNREIRENLAQLEEVLRRQRERIAELEEEVRLRQPDSTASYRRLIVHLQAQIAEKDRQIASMREEIRRQEAEVKRLNVKVTELTEENQSQGETISMQNEILTAQNDQLNTGYVRMGTRKELQAEGLLTKGLFKGGKLNMSLVDLSQFLQVDLREFRDVTLSSSKAKILTPHPSSSYSLSKNGDGTMWLEIIDPGAFWSLSNTLVIQL